MTYIKWKYGSGDETIVDQAFDVVGDFIEDVGSDINDLATSVDSESELVTRFRQETVPGIDDLLDEFGGYAISEVSDTQLAGTLQGYDIDDAENAFENNGFQLNLVAAYKYANHTSLYNSSDGSYRLKDDPHSDFQVHVTLFEWYDSIFNQTNVDVYAHAEAAPLAHPLDHYNAVYHSGELGIKIVEDIMPQWNYDYPGYSGSVDASCGSWFNWPYI